MNFDSPAASRPILLAATTGDWIQASIIMGVGIVGAIGAAWFVRRLLRGRNQMIATLAGRVVGTIVLIVGLVYGLNSVGVAIGPLIGALGVAGFAVAFALKGILSNMLAGVMIQVRRPFEIGHLVKLGDYLGRVDGVTLRAVEMTSVNGEQIIIPCANVIEDSIENWSANRYRRADVTVGVDYDADIDQAVEVLTEAIEGVDGALLDRANKVVIDQLGGSSVDIRLLVWHDLEEVHFLDFRHRVARAAKRALDGAGIGIPYPIRTLDIPSGSPIANLASADAGQAS